MNLPLHASPAALTALMDAITAPSVDPLIELAERHKRIDAGLECPRCGTRDAEAHIASVAHGGRNPMFECYAPGCRAREGSLCCWFDLREEA